MHIVKVFNHKRMIDSVKGFGKVDQSKNDCMGDSLINIGMYKVEESD